ncbi:MAG: ferredoxin [Bacteroidales bacterium]|nr:ferredoxin [Bacteroidales bacterium]
MASTFKIHQDVCIGCAECVNVTDKIALNDAGKAYFVSTGKDTAVFGTDEVGPIFEASGICPVSCIEEIG